ncbi:ECF transporter S component [Pseudalkalibacillus sp. SCS-8]|uniref:ECF transporter S component n=1 Tax=Pseudalkalibacillus nanhaiensis TaxID=3115291 RepID=UPI0032D9F963
MNSSKKISSISIFIALTAVGASFKIPAIVGSIALDMIPALIAVSLFGIVPGALVAVLGHLLSALLGGMPLGFLHLLIGIEMAFLVALFGKFYQNGKRFYGAFFFLIGNTFLAPMPFIYLVSMEFYIGILPSLFIGSLINLIVALIVLPKLVFLKQDKSVKGLGT